MGRDTSGFFPNSAPERADIYLYKEKSTLISDGSESLYTDEFKIRYRNPEKVLWELAETGFFIKEDFPYELLGSGSAYFLMEK